MTDRFQSVRVPTIDDNVYKDECLYSFDNPESEHGLFICMSTFYGIGKDHLDRHCRLNSRRTVFLNILRRRQRKIDSTKSDDEPKKVTKLAIGIEGGFDVNNSTRFTFEEKYSIYIHPDTRFNYPEQANQLPDHVRRSAEAIIAAESAFMKEERAILDATWNGEIRRVTKHSHTLQQLENGRKIPPSAWRCDRCNLTENLWLNLTDGAILCGRKFYDGTGGNNHAVEHYYNTRFPLAVKLGTITSKGADVYSYDEDDMVEDPNLSIHLAHWGINMMKMEKTERSMADLEIELNQKYGEASMIEEANSKLQPISGPGYTGMKNLGNSCYLNSVMQVLFTINDFQEVFYKRRNFYFDRSTDPVHDFYVQTGKLAHGLLSGVYSHTNPTDIDHDLKPPSSIRPQMFRSLVGRNHPEFSTKQQQDAADFLLYFLELVQKQNRTESIPDPSQCFNFQMEERIFSPNTKEARYLTRNETVFQLNIPLEVVTNRREVLEYNETRATMIKQGRSTVDLQVVRPIVPLIQSIASWAEPELIDDFQWKQNGAKITIQKTQRFMTFPDYLWIQMRKYTFNQDWTPKKLDVSIDAPDRLDLSAFRATGPQAEEIQMDENLFSHTNTSKKVNEELLQQLTMMGFPSNGCHRALLNTGNNSIEAATNWIFEHMSDPDFDAPLSSSTQVDEDNIALIMSMGFSRAHASKALAKTQNNIEAAVEWACANIEDTVESPASSDTHSTHFRDGPASYRLIAFISHIGNSPSCGHYVAHIEKEGRWIIFNDEVVALSEHPPKDLAYLYLYRREQH